MNKVQAYLEIIDIMKMFMNHNAIDSIFRLSLNESYIIQRNKYSKAVHILNDNSTFMMVSNRDENYQDNEESNIHTFNSMFIPGSKSTYINGEYEPFVHCSDDCLEEVIFQSSTLTDKNELFALQCYLSTKNSQDTIYCLSNSTLEDVLLVLDLLKEKVC